MNELDPKYKLIAQLQTRIRGLGDSWRASMLNENHPVHQKSPLVARLAHLDADARKLVWEQADEKPSS